MSDAALPIPNCPSLEALSPSFRELPAEVMVVRALASLPAFAEWSHEAVPDQLESQLLELNRQQLMTAAAACLIRLSRMTADADAAA